MLIHLKDLYIYLSMYDLMSKMVRTFTNSSYVTSSLVLLPPDHESMGHFPFRCHHETAINGKK